MKRFLDTLSAGKDDFKREKEEMETTISGLSTKYKTLQVQVKRELNIPPRVLKETHTKPAVKRRVRSLSSCREIITEPAVKPAPFPVGNYILPAKPVTGPKRFFNSYKSQKVKKEQEDGMRDARDHPELESSHYFSPHVDPYLHIGDFPANDIDWCL